MVKSMKTPTHPRVLLYHTPQSVCAGVSGMPAREMSDAEIELHIQSLGRLMAKAMAEKNLQEALHWHQAETLAISHRSPVQQARQAKTVKN